MRVDGDTILSPGYRRKRIICTIGPASMSGDVLREMEQLGVDLFRINLSHTRLDTLARTIESIRSASTTELCIDTEGPQVRTGSFGEGSVELRTGAKVRLTTEDEPGDQTSIPVRPRELFQVVGPGMMLSVDFDAVLLIVTGVHAGSVEAKVVSGGRVGSNKGVSVDREVPLPILTEKDQGAIRLAIMAGISTFALSFAASAASVRTLREIVGPDATIISKIETRLALVNAAGIARASDAILLDRGDLSREVSVEQLPFIQRDLVLLAQREGRPMYVATNLLESMTTSPHPTRAEVNDIVSTLMDGAEGLVLAAETAVGQYPVRCVRMVRRIITEFESRQVATAKDNQGWLGNGLLEAPALPHGGHLVNRVVSTGLGDDLPHLPRLRVGLSAVRDLQQIAVGVYSPLIGFMDQQSVESVLSESRLPDGVIWPLPIVLPARRADVTFAPDDSVVLECRCCKLDVAVINVRDIYSLDWERTCRRWFGTSDPKHPGVARLSASGDVLIGGDITLVNFHQLGPVEYALTPAQTRAIFAHRGWDKVVGFHTRNAPHRAHEVVQEWALRDVTTGGLFINPAMGKKKSGDFSGAAILAAYEALLASQPGQRALLSGFFSDSWYAGPREAIFTALCRKNFGCTHFIVGRDHTGVGAYYERDAVVRAFEQAGDLGIEPIFFGAVGYDPTTSTYVEDHADAQAISASAVREYLVTGHLPPDWLMRREVASALLSLGPRAFDVSQE